MNQPEQQQIDHWLEVSIMQINRQHQLRLEGFYEEKDIAMQNHYCGLAMTHAGLARAKFLNSDALDEVRAEFAHAAQYALKTFTMAYDRENPEYIGDQWPPRNPHYGKHPDIEAKWLDAGHGEVDWSCLTEGKFIEGVNYALMAADLELAQTLAGWFQDTPDGVTMDVEVNHHAHALKHTLLGDLSQARTLLQGLITAYEAKPSKRRDYRKNFYTMSQALLGIIETDVKRFNQGLLLQLDFYQGEAQGELRNTDQGFICDKAVALANLGLYHGLAVTIEYDTLPKGLLL